MIKSIPFTPALVALFCTFAIACDTPVYRYAMYRWEPTPFELYHFHHGVDGAADDAAKIESFIADARDQIENPANLEFFDVDVEADPKLQTVPPDVRRFWEAKDDKTAATFLLVNPAGHQVYDGELSLQDAKQLVDSPLRKSIGAQLAAGHAGVFLLVPGKDEALNAAAKTAVEKLVAQVNGGELELYRSPEVPEATLKVSGEESTDIEATEAEVSLKPASDAPHTVAMSTLEQAAQIGEEKWLYRSLMAVETDLAEFKDEPMVYVLYGRGRALPPYIGKGVTLENLIDITYFITGACSCTVKDQNPGIDLLMAYDWETASAAVADRFGSEEGNEEQLGDLFPQLLIPASVETTNDLSAVEEGNPPSTDELPSDGTSTGSNAADEPTSEQAAETSDNSPLAEREIDVAVAESELSAENKLEDVEPNDESKERELATADLPGRILTQEDPLLPGPNFLLILSLGLGIAFVGLLTGTFFILKAH